jgi:hypothetical protein
MQSGVYLEYLDSVGYYFTIIPNWVKGNKTFRVGCHNLKDGIINSFFLRPKESTVLFNEYSTRQEALTEAFKKADELINTSLNN